MRNFLLFLFFILLSCGKEKPATEFQELNTAEPISYDTTAIDSFSPGATSVDVVAQIRRSSQLFQDSVKQAEKVAAETELLEKAKEAEKKLKEQKLKELNRTESPAEKVVSDPN